VPRLLSAVDLERLPVAQALDVLRAALDGTGDAVLPISGAPNSTRAARALQAGTALGPGEDDDSDATALVVATSGSTGQPKGALLAASALAASAAATHERLGGAGHWLLALPPHHVAGVQVLLRSLAAGTVPGVMAPGGFRADDFAAATVQLVRRVSGPRYTALVPTQLVRLLEAGGDAVDALRQFDAVLLGGAAATPTLLRRAADWGVRVVTTYGMSETCGGCVYDGVPLEGVQVDVGERIRLGGPVVARGYRMQPNPAEFTAEAGTRWFTTDDVGQLVAGRLEVLGRADDVIVTGGKKVAPQAVEGLISALPGVRECLVVGIPDAEWGQRVVALVVGDASLEAIRRAVRGDLGPAAVPRKLLTLDALPQKSLGKPDRTAAGALAQRLLVR
jgi:O-succinylbenzoic acid--CoA ligase